MPDSNHVICQLTYTTSVMICILCLPYNTAYNVK